MIKDFGAKANKQPNHNKTDAESNLPDLCCFLHLRCTLDIMGCCCSCIEKGEGATKESEMTSNRGVTSKGKSMTISRKMSAPTVEITDSMKVRVGMADGKLMNLS